MTLLKKPLLFLLRIYQYTFSGYFGRRCRFYPTCSSYAAGAITRFGVIRGTGLALWRLMRCHPFHPGGYDPVPDSCVIKLFSENMCCCHRSDEPVS